jgi:hypothetical protein
MPTFNGTNAADNIKGDQLAGDLDDIINGLNGSDRLRGLFGDDQLFGGAGSDTLEGGEGDDELTGGAGNDALEGGTGFDRAYFSGPSTEYLISGRISIRDLVPGNGNDGTDTLRGVERAVFSDTTVLLVPNAAPVGTDDSFSTDEDTTLVVPAPAVLANDSDFESDPLSAILVTGPAHGTLVFSSDGSFTYTPSADYNGPDSFTYRVDDPYDQGNIVTVNLTVDAVNDAPEGNGDAYVTDEDTPLTVTAPGVLANDVDIDGDPLTAMLLTGPANGTLVFSSDGSFTYSPNSNFDGTDSFTYAANDGTDDSAPVTVTLTVNPGNVAPVAAVDSYVMDEDESLDIAAPGVLANDTDPDGDPLTASLVTGPANGTLIFFSTGRFVYTPLADFNGADSFSYRANDGSENSNTVTVSLIVNPVDDTPVAVADAYMLFEDESLDVAAPGVLANDSDPNGDPLTASLVTGPANGTLVFFSTGRFVYTPLANFSGADSFTYRANDGTENSNTVTVGLTVVDSTPVAAADAYMLFEDGSLDVAAPGVLANDSDPNGDPLTASLVTGPANGALVFFSTGRFVYTPLANFSGEDSFTYRTNDGTENSNTVTVGLTVVDSTPVAVGDSYVMDEDESLDVAAPGVLANDSDPNGDPLTATLQTGPANGTLIFFSNGRFVYTPLPDFNGTDSFTYAANDGSENSNTVTVTVEVLPVLGAAMLLDSPRPLLPFDATHVIV